MPNVLLLGETVDITLTFAAACPGEIVPRHIVFVFDGSDSMQGRPTRDMKAAARTVIQRIDLPNTPDTRVGVVEFNSESRALCQLTNEENRALGCVNRVDARGHTRIDLGIEEALRLLIRSRPSADRDSVTEVMVLLSDGVNNDGCSPVLDAARKVKRQGVLLIAVCVGPRCDEACMRQVAAAPRYFFRSDNIGALSQIFERIRHGIVMIFVRRVTITDVLPPNMEYVLDSAMPAGTWNEAKRRLTWDVTHVPASGISVTFKVRPLDVGYLPTSIEARATFIDNKNRSAERVFGVPFVTVLRPRFHATPGLMRPLATHTPTVE